MTPAVIFPDGALVDAPSWRSLERKLRDDPWNYSKLRKFRKDLARRARNWSGTRIDPSTERSSYEFMKDLEKAGVLLVVEEEEWTT